MTCADVLERAPQVRALVVGDICLDRWCRYDPALAEPSRETGIPRCAVTSAEVSPGAGGTVASNLAALGAGRVSVLGVVGRDGFGFELHRALSDRGIETDLLAASDAVQTFTYTKLVNAEDGTEDLPRVDFVNTEPMPHATEERIIAEFSRQLAGFDAVLVCDQAETDHGGVISPTVRTAVCEAARAHPDKVFVADSRERIGSFRGVIATPNEEEADAACRRGSGGADYDWLHRRIGGRALVVTAGPRGAWLVDGSGKRLIPPSLQADPVDPCGAGDSLSAAMALALAAGADIESALRFGIIAAGVTVGQPGTGSATPGEVLAMARRTAEAE